MDRWVLRGDLNFLRFGGFLARYDVRGRVYELIEVRTDWDTDVLNEGEVYAWHMVVDLDSDWIDWHEVLKCAGLDTASEDELDDATLAVEAATYYGGYDNFDIRPLGDEEKITIEQLSELLHEQGADEFWGPR